MKRILQDTFDIERTPRNLSISVRKMLIFGVKSLEELEQVVKMLAMHTYSGHKIRGVAVAMLKMTEAEDDDDSEESESDSDDDDRAADDDQTQKNTTRPKYFAQDILMGEFSFCLYVEYSKSVCFGRGLTTTPLVE
jgi:hypothetical protein